MMVVTPVTESGCYRDIFGRTTIWIMISEFLAERRPSPPSARLDFQLGNRLLRYSCLGQHLAKPYQHHARHGVVKLEITA
jgi:hypothetical protein